MGRFVFVVLDGVGVGALPDAAAYGDAGSDTLGNLSRVVSLRLPFLKRCGLGNIVPILGVPPEPEPLCLPGRLAPRSAGKDTTVGHWEHMGLVTPDAFPTYPAGFPDEVITAFTQHIGVGVLGNRPASGTAIIAELGEEHLATRKPIVYTSADSVFQIAAHVDVVPLEQLYAWCKIARELLTGRHAVARVIARPFMGPPGSFVRTKDRRDYSLDPPGPLYLDLLHQAGVPVLALGKISEVFVGRGVSRAVKVGSNDENLALVQDLVAGRSPGLPFDEGLLMTNLVDFDMLWGHRNDVGGFARGLETVDAALPALVEALRPDDTLLITADHGVDPTTPSTDHSREYVPVLVYPRPEDAPHAVYDGGFADTGATVYECLTGRPAPLEGSNILALRPRYGWRRYTAAVECGPALGGAVPQRLGTAEAAEAASWLVQNVGPAPDAAVILGSGLSPEGIDSVIRDIPYSEIPHWPSGSVQGHAQKLSVVEWMGWTVAVLKGRVHEYEGYDWSEVQLPVRSLAGWGVRRLVLTTACGAVTEDLAPGDVVVVEEVVEPLMGPGMHASWARHMVAADAGGARPAGFKCGTHASLPGPQYETPAELVHLGRLGVATVSMSPGAELRAAREAGQDVAVLAVVANSGDTTHEEVLHGAALASRSLARAVAGVFESWGAPTSVY